MKLASAFRLMRRPRGGEAELVAARAELARQQAVFREELDRRLDAQQQLRESDGRLRAIIDSAPIALFATDRNGVITFAAGTGPDPLGKRSGEAIGWSVYELFVQHPQVAEAIRQALSGNKGQLEMTQDDRVFVLRLAPLRDASLKTAGAIVVATEVTERRRAEAELRKTFETLKQVDRQRRALLARVVTAQEEERRRIAADIHDDSIQSMFAVAVRLLTMRSALRDPSQIELIDRLQNAVQAASDRLRRLLFELRPPALDEGGLAAALREYLDVLHEESGIEVHLNSELPAGPTKTSDLNAFRIAREALANVRKHAHAKRVECSLTMEDGGIHVRIADDGVGFVSSETPTVPGHLGLLGMRERAEMAGGRFRITSQPDRGCVVEFWLPAEGKEVADAA